MKNALVVRVELLVRPPSTDGRAFFDTSPLVPLCMNGWLGGAALLRQLHHAQSAQPSPAPPGPDRWRVTRSRGRVDLHDFWHARHLSNLPRPYTNLIREVVSQIIGTGGMTI